MSRPGKLRMVRVAAISALLSMVVAAFAWLTIAYFEYNVPFGQLWALSLGLMLVWWLLGSVGAPPPPQPASPLVAEVAPARPFAQAERWQRRLSTTDRDPEWYQRVVRDRIAGLVDERLRQQHHLRLHGPAAESDASAAPRPDAPASGNAAARAVLGEELYAFLTAPIVRTPTPAELGRLLTRIEEI